ncbi:MAG: ATP-binding protein [Chloroflexi bacterium]|nr:ATP-binding protein [Chloroflexota bacterium]
MAQRIASAEHRRLLESLERLPEPVAHPVLMIISGLPGTGKSHFSRRLTERVALAMLESDALRKALFSVPTYSASESSRLFRLTHALIGELLDRGVPVLLDATNLVEARRRRLYTIADQRDVKLVMVRVEAPPEVVRERLAARNRQEQREDHSDADWSVYERMRRSDEPISRSHFTVDTSEEIGPAVEMVVREITRWMRGVG